MDHLIDTKGAASDALEASNFIGEPSGTRTLANLIKSWERQSIAALIISGTLVPTFDRRALPDSRSLAMS